jgi:arylsulfatase
LDPRDAELFDWAGAVADTDDDGPGRYPKLLWQCLRSDAPTLPSLRAGVELLRESPAGSGRPGVESVIRRLDGTDVGSPAFLLVNLMEMHTPYWPPEPYRVTDEPVAVTIAESFTGTAPSRERLADGYAASSRYLAERYRELFDRLTDAFDYVITCSDHGELLGEYGMYNHGYGLYEELVHVPLVVSGPGVEPGTCDEPVSLLDVYETIRSLAGVGEPRRGRSLLGSLEPRAHLTEYHGFLPWHRDQLRRHGVPDAVYDAYDSPRSGIVAADGRYGWETHLTGGTETGFTGDPRLRGDLDELRASLSVRAVEADGAEEDIDDAVRARLEDLGYA